jgi:hypothetical protein
VVISYALFNPYLDAMLLLVSPSSLAIIPFAVVVEWLILPVLTRTSGDWKWERKKETA